jgi:serine beta-lactamase-like protein LACTB
VPKKWNRIETWLAVAAIGIGGVITALAGLHLYVTATATPIHADPRRVPSVARAGSPSHLAEAVSRGRESVRAAVAAQNLPGVSVAVGAEGQVVWAEGFGWADLETHAPVSPETRFRIGTASTVLSSAAAGLLVEQGRLKLDDEIQAYVPEFPKKQWPVTVRQLMGHVAGVRNDGGDEGALLGEHCERPLDALQEFGDRALLFEPGTRYRVSSYGWILLSAAIEAASREPFLRFMEQQVFEPLGMRDTRPDSASDTLSHRATPYFPRYAADPRYGPDEMRSIDYSCYAGASVFLSTPSDLVRFGLGVDGGMLLKPATIDLLQTSQRLTTGQDTGYGLGWDIETVPLAGAQVRMVGHDGESLGGTVASLMTFRDRGLVVAVISNVSYADTPAIALKIAEAFAVR